MQLRLTNLKKLREFRLYLKRHRWMLLLTLIAALSIALMPLAPAMRQGTVQSESGGIGALIQRVGTPSQEAIEAFTNAGMENLKPHILTSPERARLGMVLASLPELHRQILEKKLHRLAFVDGIPGEGTGLTSPFLKTGLYDITLRTSILDESLSTFLTTKEHRVFTEDGSGVIVSIDATGADALTYVLLHESAHVVDRACRITANPRSHFVAGIWTSQGDLIPPLALSVAAKTFFRGGSPVKVKRAANIYEGLAETPFVSLYATAAASEDFAELVAWREIQRAHHGSLTIWVKAARGKTLGQWQPLTFPQVKKRFSNVDKLLASSADRCGRVEGSDNGLGAEITKKIPRLGPPVM